MLEECHYYFNKAADLIGLSARVRKILITPRRVVKVEIVIESDAGKTTPLYRVSGAAQQHSRALQRGLTVSPRARRGPCGSPGQSDDLEDRHRRCTVRGC